MPTSSESEMDNYNHCDPLHLLKPIPSEEHSEELPKTSSSPAMDNLNHSNPLLLLKQVPSKTHFESFLKVKYTETRKGTQLSTKHETAATLSSIIEDPSSSSRNLLPKIPLGECTCYEEETGSRCDFCVTGPIYMCPNCRKEFRSHVLLTEHFLIFHGHLKFVCQKCGRGFISRDLHKRHTNCRKGYVCYKCINKRMSFRTSDELAAHLVEHKLPCHLCHKSFSSRAGLKNHCLQLHNEVIMSREANKLSIEIQGNVMKQTLRIPNIPIGKCTCQYADQCIKCKFCLNGPEYICPNCRRSYSTFEMLVKHFVETHNRYRYICQECGCGYIGKGSLQRHINEKACYGSTRSAPVCKDCGMNFKRSDILRKHIRTVHK